MQTLPKPSERFTYGDYRRWPDEERWELIDGEAYLCPAPTREHQDFVGGLFVQIAVFLNRKPCRPYIAPFDVRLPKQNESDDNIETVVQPDISVICDRSRLDRAGCRGAPDWIIEILSPKTANRDQILKRRLYERHGVREYWLVHPEDRILTRYFLEEGRYTAPLIEEVAGTTEVRTLPGLVIDWSFAEPEPDPTPIRHP